MKRDITYLYRHFDKNNDLLYVGISWHVLLRTERHGVTAKWFNKITHIKIEKFSDRGKALRAERVAIKEEKPKYNRQYLDRELKKINTRSNVIDFHFSVPKTKEVLAFIEEADRLGRSYTEHFRRILRNRFHPEEPIND